MGKASITISAGKHIEPEKWDAFIQSSPQGSLYMLHGYLTALRPDWETAIVEEHGEWKLLMPYVINRKAIYEFLPQLPLTQFGGPIYVNMHEMSRQKQLGKLDQWLGLLLDNWREKDLIILHSSPHADYLLPFHWEGFELRKRYTFWWNVAKDEAHLLRGMGGTRRRRIRAAEKAGLTFHIDPDGEGLWHLLRKNRDDGHDLLAGNRLAWDRLGHLIDFLVSNKLGEVIVAHNKDGQVVSASLMGRYQNRSLYLVGAYDPEIGRSGAMPWLIWQYVKLQKPLGVEILDFEGSMIQGIAQFVRDFGAYPVAYTQLYRNQLPAVVSWIRELKT